uniref:Protein Abitram n=1 Tax=Timema tahoe TaxID=61484 RepID=A0A7R9NXT7_9NEOP|nr:unnamed protein product [Timema tahoe]
MPRRDKDNPNLSVKDEVCSGKETDILLPNPNIVIVEEVNDYSESNLTVTERYFTPRYCVDPNNKVGEDQCILFHSNRICLVTLAPSHPIIAEKKKISKIDFQVTPKLNRMENKPTGKGKRGAQYVQSTSVLCLIDCDDETKYKVSSCLIGKLVEVNEELLNNPQLIVEAPQAEGHVAIVLPNFHNYEKQKNALLTEEQYKEHVMKLKTPEIKSDESNK